ncbi:hypothetical protein RUM43_008263, partial [Polyplax serrata]
MLYEKGAGDDLYFDPLLTPNEGRRKVELFRIQNAVSLYSGKQSVKDEVLFSLNLSCDARDHQIDRFNL